MNAPDTTRRVVSTEGLVAGESPGAIAGCLRRNPHVLILVGVIVLAGALRVRHLDYGLPQFLLPDEAKYTRMAKTYLKSHRIANPHYFLNPPLFSHVVLGTTALLDLMHVRLRGEARVVMISRVLSALLGTASVGLLYLLGSRLAGRKVGLVAALLLAGNFLAIRSSHQGVNDMMMLSLMLLSIDAFVRGTSGEIGAERLPREAVMAAFVAGLAFSTKYNGGIALMPICALMLLRWGLWIRCGLLKQRWTAILREAGTIGGWCALGVLAGNPWILETPKEVWGGISLQMEVAEECWPGQELTPMSYQVVKALAQGCGVAVLLFAGIGVVLVARARPLALSLLTLTTLTYLAYFAFVSKALFARFLLPAVPGICLLATMGLEQMVSFARMRLKSAASIVLVGLALTQPIYNSFQYLTILSRPDTRTLAAQWAVRHVPRASDRYYLFRKDVLKLERYGFAKSRPATIGADGKFDTGHYLVTGYDIQEGCMTPIDLRVGRLKEQLFQQGTVIYHDNPAPHYTGPRIHENRYSPYYELGTIEREGPEIWFVEVKR